MTGHVGQRLPKDGQQVGFEVDVEVLDHPVESQVRPKPQHPGGLVDHGQHVAPNPRGVPGR